MIPFSDRPKPPPKSDPGTLAWYEENKDRLTFAEKEKHRFLTDVFVKKKSVPTVVCAFGPEEDGYSDGYIDSVTVGKDGGTFTKLYGCPFKIKGMSPKNVVFGLRLAKHMFSGFPKSIVKHSKLVTLALGLTWLFNRRGFLNILCDLMHAIDHKTVEHLTYSKKLKSQWPDNWYNDMEKEIERCLLLASKGEGLWEKFFKMFARFIKIFLYIDNTYKSRVQDGLYGAGNIKQVLNTLYSREVKDQGSTGRTWWIYRIALSFMFITSPALRRIEKRFFENLDQEKVKMDLDDWYFACTYKSYNFRGLPLEVRREERKKLNAEYSVVML